MSHTHLIKSVHQGTLAFRLSVLDFFTHPVARVMDMGPANVHTKASPACKSLAQPQYHAHERKQKGTHTHVQSSFSAHKCGRHVEARERQNAENKPVPYVNEREFPLLPSNNSNLLSRYSALTRA
eukprot:833126-Pelagomonas_calceolata.AAC.2